MPVLQAGRSHDAGSCGPADANRVSGIGGLFETVQGPEVFDSVLFAMQQQEAEFDAGRAEDTPAADVAANGYGVETQGS